MRRVALAVLVCAASSAAAQTADSLTARLARIVDAAHTAGTFDGVVRVGRGDQVVHERAIGLADRAWNVPNTLETRFPWASVTKQVTATVVLQLVGEGRMTLDTSVGEVVPGLRAEHAGRIRIWHLLTISSGLPDPDTAFVVTLAPDDDTVLIVLANTDAPDISQTYVGSGFSADLIRTALSSL